MASHVVVIDASLRRVTIKTNPGTHLSNILDEACSKLGLKAEQYSLKHDNKQVDLARTIRLSGLSSGAKLNLVQASRSPSVVSVALQLPAEGDSSGTLARLTDKFPSNTPIWQILRRFEAGAAGTTASPRPNYNFTQRATPLLADGASSGSGRLCYEMPVVNVMGRELGSFVDLQKTLGQLGFNGGSCLLRLQYRNTQKPLEEAMTEITRYFSSMEDPVAAPTRKSEAPRDSPMPDAQPAAVTTDTTTVASESAAPKATLESSNPQIIDNKNSQQPIATISSPSNDSSVPPGISIFSPPSSTTPAAASISEYNEADYVPTIAHAQHHQARLASESRNKKLLSDAEIAAQEQTRSATLSVVKEVVVRFRFPDQSQAQRSFGQEATTNGLYALCRELMDRPGGEDFAIRTIGGKGSAETLQESTKRLIQDLGWQGRVLVTVVWGDKVSAQTRTRPSLKEQYRKQAEALRVDLSQANKGDEEETMVKQTDNQTKREGGGSKQDKESKLKGFLKGLSRK